MAQTAAIPPADDHRNVPVDNVAPVRSRPRLLVVDRWDIAEPRLRGCRAAMPGPNSTVESRSSCLAICRGSLGVQCACEHLLVLVHPADRARTLPDTDGCAVAGVLPLRLPRSVVAGAGSDRAFPADHRVRRTPCGFGNCVCGGRVGATRGIVGFGRRSRCSSDDSRLSGSGRRVCWPPSLQPVQCSGGTRRPVYGGSLRGRRCSHSSTRPICFRPLTTATGMAVSSTERPLLQSPSPRWRQDGIAGPRSTVSRARCPWPYQSSPPAWASPFSYSMTTSKSHRLQRISHSLPCWCRWAESWPRTGNLVPPASTLTSRAPTI